MHELIVRTVQAMAIESLCCRNEYGSSGGIRPRGDIEGDPISSPVVVVSILAQETAACFYEMAKFAVLTPK